ncbi:MAG: hypothetical protein GX115_16855 [Ruminiclostridium sp.]|nr:hypothetical protein [Ruminiclostridium sp.]
MKKNNILVLMLALLLLLTACGNKGDKNNIKTSKPDTSVKNTDVRSTTSKDAAKDNPQTSFMVNDFIQKPDKKITQATGGRARELTAIPAFPDANKHFTPSTEDFCLMCYPAVVYREDVDTKTDIARFDLISFNTAGEVDSHYQAFVFDNVKEAEKYHEFRKNRDGVKYRELYAGSKLTEDMMTGCAKRYDNIIYFNVGFNTVGMEEAYTKTYLAGEQSFYEGIGYSFLYSLNDYTADPYSHYQWTEDDNKYFYPTSHRFSITKRFNSYDPDGRAATENVQVIEYTLYNYDEYGNLFSKSKKFEFPDEAGASNFITNNEAIFHIHDDEIVEHDPIGSSGKFIFDFRNIAATGTEKGVYFSLLGEEYMERDADYDDGQYPEAGMGVYYFFSYRDKECPTEVKASKIASNAIIEEPNPKHKGKTETKGTGSFEAYFCSEQRDTILNKPICEMFVRKDGNKAILHIVENRDGFITYESITTGVYDEIFKPEQVSVFEADNLADAVVQAGEYVLTMIDKDNLVLNADDGNVMLDYLLTRAEHTVQQ